MVLKCYFIYFAVSDEFVLQKLKKECVEDGAYLLRWSILDYQRIILAVLSRTKVTFVFYVFGKFPLVPANINCH